MDLSNSAGRDLGRFLSALNTGNFYQDFRSWIVAGMAIALGCVGMALVLDDLLKANYLIGAAISILPATMLATLWLLLFQRNLAAAANILVTGLFIVVTLIMALSGGQAAGAYVAAPIIVLTAGIVANRRLAAICAVGCIMMLVCAAWLTTRNWAFPVSYSPDQFVWGMTRTSILACALNLIALLLYRQSTDRTQARLNDALAREERASATLTGLLDKHLSSMQLLFKLQQIGQLSGWWFDPVTRRVHHTLTEQGELSEFDLDDAQDHDAARNALYSTLRALITEAEETGRSWNKEHAQPAPDGTERWYRSTGEVQYEGGKVKSIIGVFQDITDFRSAQARRAHSQKLEAMGTLAAGLAHEINTPIQYVSHNVSFISESVTTMRDLTQSMLEGISADANTDISQLRSQMQKQAADADLEFVLEELPLALSETESGLERIANIVLSMKSFAHPGQHDMAPTDLNQAIESTLRIAANRCQDSATIEVRPSPSLPLVHCAADQINQVVLNILVNAADAIRDAGSTEGNAGGTIVIATTHDASHVEISISDNGPGIPPDVRERIFDPFFTTKEVGKGSGQGLAISYDVVVNGHKGELLCDSAVGRGTTFRVRLPLHAGSSSGTSGR